MEKSLHFKLGIHTRVCFIGHNVIGEIVSKSTGWTVAMNDKPNSSIDINTTTA